MADPNSGIGSYTDQVGTGTAHTRVLSIGNNSGNNRASPTDFGFVAVPVAAPYASDSSGLFTPTSTIAVLAGAAGAAAGLLFVPLGQKRDLIALAFMMAKYTAPNYSSANNLTANVGIFLVHELHGANAQIEVDAEHVCDALLTASTQQFPNSLILNPNAYAVDTIAVSVDNSLSPGVRVTGQPSAGNNGTAWMQFDSKGAVGVLIAAGNGATDRYLHARAKQV